MIPPDLTLGHSHWLVGAAMLAVGFVVAWDKLFPGRLR